MTRAFIFDLDGTLADTEPLHLAAFNAVFRDHGIGISEADYFNPTSGFIGLNDRDCFATALRQHGKHADDEEIAALVADKSEVFQTMAAHRAKLFPGAERFVRAAAERFPLIVVTGALRADAEATLRGTGLRDLFLDVVAAEDAECGKNAPEPFIAALGRLGFILRNRNPIQPRECLAVEDSPYAIDGAHRAGMKALAIAHTVRAEALSAAEIVRPSMLETDLDDVLRALAESDSRARKGAS
ncbi:MAG: HAD family hydrolase [Candidatus Binataceae bacterium]